VSVVTDAGAGSGFSTESAAGGPGGAPPGDIIIQAESVAQLNAIVGRLPRGPRAGRVYGLVVTPPAGGKPTGDLAALYRAVAINLKVRPPAGFEKVADHSKPPATGRLYSISRYESGDWFANFLDFIKPELYNVYT